MQVDDLRSEYPELAGWNLTQVDVVDDGEKLLTIPEASQDFSSPTTSSSAARTRSGRSRPTSAI